VYEKEGGTVRVERQCAVLILELNADKAATNECEEARPFRRRLCLVSLNINLFLGG